MSEEQERRPRFGVLRRGNGESRTVVFYPHESLPNTFVCHYADNEEVAVVDAKNGDRIQVDNLAPGQAIFIEYPNQPGPVRGRLKSDKDKDMAENENNEDKAKDPNAGGRASLVSPALCSSWCSPSRASFGRSDERDLRGRHVRLVGQVAQRD